MQTSDEIDVSDRQKRKLTEQSLEIATLTLLVRDIEALNQELIQRQEWFGQVALVLLTMPAWRWTPRAVRDRRIRRKLARHNLFDGDAYLARYPDVAEAGIDPLVHYIAHGLTEGRQR